MVYITRRETFAAAHRLFKPGLSDEENFEMFGKCSNPQWHGHNYTLEVVVAGKTDPETGFVMDLKELKKIIHKNVIDKVDHKNLNLDTDFMKGIIPTSENICIAIWKQLQDKIPAGKLYAVKLYETENNYFEYRGE
ncbi:MAG TPA: 6-carboxytetrahydropterin synthase [Ignavibacteriaceae bacterium]|nr:6-carboxytetrahydropterin synthase [Ignavibacteriaceae bacterium]